MKKAYLKVVIAVLVIAGLFFAFRLLNIDFSSISENKFKSLVESLGVWGPLLYIAVYLLRPLILFPAGVLSAAAGVIWGPALGFLYLQIAANISSTAEFFIARYFARGALEKKLKGKVELLDKKIKQHGFWTVLLIRLIPNVAWDIQNLSLGLTSVRFRDYFFATLIGIIPGSFAFVFFGASLIKVLFNPKSFWIIGIAVLIFVGVFLFTTYLKKKHKDKIDLKGGKE